MVDVDVKKFFTEPDGFRMAIEIAGLPSCEPEELLGKTFRFQCARRHDVIGTILGIHLDVGNALGSLNLTVSNRLGFSYAMNLRHVFNSGVWILESRRSLHDTVNRDWCGTLKIL